MNKQELTEMVKNAEVAAQTGINLIRRYKDEDSDYQRGQRNAYRDVATWIEEFDEQPKVTIPQFVADWIKECKRNATLTDCLKGKYEISIGRKLASEDFQNWVVDNENDELTAKAWMFGYEVEKEPLYQIELPGTSWGAYLTKADNGDLVIFQNTTSGSTFTESEIKSIDERYWAFAVPVEEDK
ncbi:DUF1642 domain-containing protein [Enterococcus casseliflavus]|uniref:DUF1642 domain-containing protein n=1 Tax=Enterococcus casseliflavus TaxID=37734 RepID=UPI003D6A3313